MSHLHADLILTGARLYPVGAEPVASGAVAIRAGRILAVGTPADVARARGPNTRTIRLAPTQLVIPGFNDSHQHLLSYVRARSRLQLWGTTRLDQVRELIAAEARRQPPGTWIVAVGHDQGRLAERRHPTLSELDAVAPDHPLLIYRACSHVALANSRALAAAGLGERTPDPPGGRLERADGRLTGVLQESAIALVRRAVVEPAPDWQRGLREAAHEYHRRGITSIGEAALGHLEGLRDLERLRAAIDNGMRLRVYAMAHGEVAEHVLAADDRPQIADRRQPVAAEGPSAATDEWFHIGAIKIFADGTLGGGTAWLSEDYGDEPGNRGWPVLTADELYAQVERAHTAGLQVAVHAIGDATAAMVLDAYERVLARHPRPGARHRIEHLEVLSAGIPARIAALDVVAAIQSPFTYWESGDVTRLGPGLAPWGHAWGALQRAGVTIANGSDNPVLPDFAPLQGIYAAVTRTTHAGLTLGPEHALTLQEALWSYTAGGAYASLEEERKGTLAPGSLADIVVLSDDLRTPAGLLDTKVDMTLVGGEIVYERA